jgi:nitrous oxidase accessory protein
MAVVSPVLVTLAMLSALQGPAAGRVLEVGRGGAYPRPAEALAASVPGDTVRLLPGEHAGPLVVRVSGVTLTGPRTAVIDGGRRGTAVTIAADSVTLDGFTVRSSGRSMDHDDAAIKLERCTGCSVLRIAVRDPLHGIYLLESRGVRVEDNDILGASDLIESARGNGIHLFNSTGNRLLRNRVRATRDGMYFSFASGNLVAGNEVSRARYGLHYMYSDDNRFEDNVFVENAAGAAVMFSKRIELRRNVFARHVGYRAYGFLLHTGEDILAEGNRFEGNLTGLHLDGAVRNTFRNNLLSGNGTGIDLMASAEGNGFTGNVFRHNRTAVRKVLGGGENAWSLDGRGNDWGDPSVFDLDRDGIGDRPYRAGDPFLTLAASRPALEIYGGTLAARALSWAEEAFPVFGIPRIVDSLPVAPRSAGDRFNPAMVPPMVAITFVLGVMVRRRRRGATRGDIR